MMEIAVIGGGAAGFFSAITAKENHPHAVVVIFEKSKHPLAKVKISGGGRCNVTNGCSSIKTLVEAYPRGGNALKKVFGVFNNKHAMQWFESRGVPLVVQDDGCVFPASQSAQSIIDCFLKEAARLGVTIEVGCGITAIRPAGGKLALTLTGSAGRERVFDKVIVATGGCPTRKGLAWLEALGHKIQAPVPSLFTFNMPSEPVTKLMGVVVEKTLVSIQGTRLRSEGPLLVTHWGMSGPAILKLSSFGARTLSEKGYAFTLQVNWTGVQNHGAVTDQLNSIAGAHSHKYLSNCPPSGLPQRLWMHLAEKAGIPANRTWCALGRKGMHRLLATLTNDMYAVSGKSAFREEFVTCGGISLESVDMTTMQSRACKNLYFAGELLDIDGITGGYNFQAAWTTGFIAGRLK